MKTSHLIAAGVVVGAFILITKSRNGGVGSDMLVPPRGRTVTAGGQVLGGLGIDSYDANPSQYNRTPQNDFVPGLGLSPDFSKMGWGVVPIQSRQKGAATLWVARKGAGSLTQNEAVKQALEKNKMRQGTSGIMPRSPAKKQNAFGAQKARAEAKQAREKKKQTQAAANKAKADAVKAKKDEADKAKASASSEAERLRIAAIAQQQINETLTAIQDRANTEMAEQERIALNAEQIAREQESISAASDDSGYGSTSSDSGYGPTEDGAAPIPERVAEVQTQDTTVLPPQDAPAEGGDTKVGLLVGGGILAAIAAALAT
jgi:hypothetical protein